MTMNNYQLILGVREIPRPRGEGYLYYKIVPLQEEAQKKEPSETYIKSN